LSPQPHCPAKRRIKAPKESDFFMMSRLFQDGR
jgi:hypothetical protein